MARFHLPPEAWQNRRPHRRRGPPSLAGAAHQARRIGHRLRWPRPPRAGGGSHRLARPRFPQTRRILPSRRAAARHHPGPGDSEGEKHGPHRPESRRTRHRRHPAARHPQHRRPTRRGQVRQMAAQRAGSLQTMRPGHAARNRRTAALRPLDRRLKRTRRA